MVCELQFLNSLYEKVCHMTLIERTVRDDDVGSYNNCDITNMVLPLISLVRNVNNLVLGLK